MDDYDNEYAAFDGEAKATLIQGGYLATGSLADLPSPLDEFLTGHLTADNGYNAGEWTQDYYYSDHYTVAAFGDYYSAFVRNNNDSATSSHPFRCVYYGSRASLESLSQNALAADPTAHSAISCTTVTP
jgi:hypothetical protein